MYRALQLSIERDKDRTISFMIFVVSDKQRWNFITPSWLVALYSEYEETGHIIEPLFCELGHSGGQSIELNFLRSPGTRFFNSRFKHSPLCFTLNLSLSFRHSIVSSSVSRGLTRKFALSRRSLINNVFPSSHFRRSQAIGPSVFFRDMRDCGRAGHQMRDVSSVAVVRGQIRVQARLGPDNARRTCLTRITGIRLTHSARFSRRTVLAG